MAYLAGALTLAFVVFGWSFNVTIGTIPFPLWWIVIALILASDFVLDS